MKQLLLAVALIAVPVAAFTAFNMYQVKAIAAQSGLGDTTAFKAIVADVQKIAASGDLRAAKNRIKDFETAWDDAADQLRPLDTQAWGSVDDAADQALSALRSKSPTADQVKETLVALLAELDHPTGAAGDAAATGPVMVSGVAITDAGGRALPCENMLATLSMSLKTVKLADAQLTKAQDLQTKATERCNADDDRHADEFTAQAIALTKL